MMQTLKSIYEQLDEIKTLKDKVIKSQDFERAASLRDSEKKLLKEAEAFEQKNKLYLSKSKYVRGLNCSKSLWLYVHKYHEQQFSEMQESIFQQGNEVGILARQLFPEGVLAVEDGTYPGFASAAYTRSLLEKGVTTIYEATFVYENIIVAVDVLDFKNGVWNIFEVKSTTKVKDVHYTDAAIQYYVVSACLRLTEMYIVHFNRNYIRMGGLNLKKLFTATKISATLNTLQKDIPAHIRRLKLLVLNNEPEVAMGSQCNSPYPCSFLAYCQKQSPADNFSAELPPMLRTHIDENAIHDFVAQVEYPIGFLDFETIMPGIPMFDQSRPYQQVVFQYSLHSQGSPGAEIVHHECLADHTGDPRLQIIPALIMHSQHLETIFVYNIAFERSRLNEMAFDFPEFAEALNGIAYKLLDLMPVFRIWYRTPEMGNQYSIKVVLPALCPDMRYDELPISNGGSASNAFMQLYQESNTEKKSEIYRQLIRYCTQDTLAMVRLWEILKKV